MVEALSSADQARPGPYYLWLTSFREGCSVLVLDVPLTGTQVMALSGLSLLAGAGMTFFWLSRWWRERAKSGNALSGA